MLDANSRQMTTQCLLRRAAAGDEAAVDALLRHSCDRLTRLTRRMLGDGLLEPERKAAERP